jgi:glycogen synthase
MQTAASVGIALQRHLELWQLQDARTILAIHNMAHQGVEPAATFANLGVPDDMWLLLQLMPQHSASSVWN